MGDTAWSHEDGDTPLDEDESAGLIPAHIVRRAELNAWEAENIREAIAWSERRRVDMLDLRALRALHQKMFAKTWRWAGTYRTSDKSIGPYPWYDVPRLLTDLIRDTKAQYAIALDSVDGLDALAVRFHHQLVRIHPWPNGNGRHARLATDLLLRNWGRPPFSWGSRSVGVDAATTRSTYLEALRAADAGRYDALMRFVRT
jgi:Fic-DOC domain mobile mystery protein B